MPLPPSVTVAGCHITVLDKLKTLGVMSDATLRFENYVNYVAKVIFALSVIVFDIITLNHNSNL